MPFRSGFDDIYDQTTLELLQSIFDSVWPILCDANTRVSREDVARRILAAYAAGNSPDQIKKAVLSGIQLDGGRSTSAAETLQTDIPETRRTVEN